MEPLLHRSATAVKLPRWCPLCITNGYHKPENCPEKKKP